MTMPPPPPMSHSRVEDGLRPPPPHEEVPLFMVYMNVLNTITHVLLGAVVFFGFFISNIVFGSDFKKFSAHVYLTLFGYTILVSQALYSLNPQTGMANNFKYPQKTMLFWLLQVLGSFLAIIGGIMAIVGVKEINNSTIFSADHLQSSHAIVGLIAMILTTVSLVGGLAQMFLKGIKNNSMLAALYSCSVTLTLVMAFVAICLKYNDTRELVRDSNANLAISFAVLTLAGMFVMMISNKTVGGRFLI